MAGRGEGQGVSTAAAPQQRTTPPEPAKPAQVPAPESDHYAY